MRLIHESCFALAAEAGISLTISAGGTLVSDADGDAGTALKRADEAMYEAKRAGRDRLVVRLA